MLFSLTSMEPGIHVYAPITNMCTKNQRNLINHVKIPVKKQDSKLQNELIYNRGSFYPAVQVNRFIFYGNSLLQVLNHNSNIKHLNHSPTKIYSSR